MTFFGDKVLCAIEAEIEELVEGWILGRFRLWLCGFPIGNADDTADLRGISNWWRDFIEIPRSRYESALRGVSADDVFRILYDSVMLSDAPKSQLAARIPDIYERFHISHLGMSSFDRVDMLLLKDAQGAERVVWRSVGEPQIRECRLPPGELERVGAAFVAWVEAQPGVSDRLA